MAGLYIKGMKMPECCDDCKLFNMEYDACNYTNCSVGYEYSNKRMDDCPLVEVPDHGDLIDRDAFAKDLSYDVEMDEKALDNTDIVGIERTHLQFDKDCKQNCMYYLTEQEAVIPADKEGV